MPNPVTKEQKIMALRSRLLSRCTQRGVANTPLVHDFLDAIEMLGEYLALYSAASDDRQQSLPLETPYRIDSDKFR